VDETLSATENLVLFGRLLGLSRGDARRKAVELLEEFGLTEAAKRPLKNFSGGMRRRLDLAASLLARPPLIFLDEPTTGLDPPTPRASPPPCRAPTSSPTCWSRCERLTCASPN